jgi:hypothetical protein
MITYILFWLPMVLLAIANGLFRESVLKRQFSEAAAHQVSTLTLLILLTIYMQWVLRLHPPGSMLDALWVGLLWMLLTVAFEAGLGISRGIDVSVMLADYNLVRGKLWALVPLWMLVAPSVFFVLKNKL